MAIQHHYCNAAADGTGNDFDGTTFTDGSFANATLTLTRTGAFTNAQVGHRFYLADNGSGEVTAGIYEVATVPDANSVTLTADIRSGAPDPTDVVCTQHDGTTSLEWHTVQKGLDICSGTAGNQINVNAANALVLSTAIVWTNYSPTNTRDNPLIIRGYTTAADDGGVGEIDGNNAAANIFATASFPAFVEFIDLKLHNTTGSVLSLPALTAILRCEIYNGGSTNTLNIALNYIVVMFCNIHTGTSGAVAINGGGSPTHIHFNRITGHNDFAIFANGGSIFAVGNLIHGISHHGMDLRGDLNFIYGNTLVGDSTAGRYGITMESAGAEGQMILSNIIKDFGSAGTGAAVNFLAGSNALLLGYNNLHGNDDDVYDGELIFGLDLTAFDTFTDPTFTNAGAGDFSVGTNAQGDGYPDTTAWPGAATDGYTDVGAVQRQEAGGGGLLVHPGLSGGMRG